MIYYLTPFCSQKRLGHIHNQYCALVPNDDDYICLMDPDVMFLHPHQMTWIEDIVTAKGGDWDLLGCMTNRIGVKQQCYKKHIPNFVGYGDKRDPYQGDTIEVIFDNDNILFHMQEAIYLHSKGTYIIEETDLIAGFLMIFKKSLWNKIKFQEGINFDIKFCEAVRASGGRIGIMKGIYIYHNYRMGKDKIKDKSHLLNRPQ